MADVQDFLVQARDEFLSSYTTNTIGRSRSSTEAPEDMDWIASFLRILPVSSIPSTKSRRSGRRQSRPSTGGGRRRGHRLLLGRSFVCARKRREQSSRWPHSPRRKLSKCGRAEDPNQWWYDFLFATQRRYIDCASNDDCASIFHRGDGLICCDVGADFFGHTHNSCVDSTTTRLPISTTTPRAPQAGTVASVVIACTTGMCASTTSWIAMTTVRIKENTRVQETNSAVSSNPSGTICIDEGLQCPPPPPECAPGSLGSECLSNPDRICCDEVCCPYAPAGEEQWQCCVVCGLTICNKGDCPNPFCPEPPFCSIPGNELQPCDPSGVGRTPPSDEGICCGDTCCSNSGPANYCCEDPVNSGNLVCRARRALAPARELRRSS